MTGKRIKKIIAESGFCSRREAEKFIRQNKVLVNGKIAKLGNKANQNIDTIIVDNFSIPKTL